jgi:hypothetical protein
MNRELSICCWKWQPGEIRQSKKKKGFTAHHVNTLFSMIDRHYDKPYQKICITDDPEGIDKDVKIVPLWDDYRDMGGCFVRLKMFSSEMRKILGPRFVSIDLDCVIVDDLSPLLDREDDFIIWGDPERVVKFCGSFWMMDAGVREEVWVGFNPDLYKVRANGTYKGGTDQVRITHCLEKRSESMWTKEDGVYNFQADIRHPERRIGKKKARRMSQAEREERVKRIGELAMAKAQEAYTHTYEKQIANGRKEATARYLANRSMEKYVDKEVGKSLEKLKKEERLRSDSFMEERRKMLAKKQGGDGNLPDNARIVFFNGKHDPSDPELREAYPWIGEHWK